MSGCEFGVWRLTYTRSFLFAFVMAVWDTELFGGMGWGEIVKGGGCCMFC